MKLAGWPGRRLAMVASRPRRVAGWELAQRTACSRGQPVKRWRLATARSRVSTEPARVSGESARVALPLATVTGRPARVQGPSGWPVAEMLSVTRMA